MKNCLFRYYYHGEYIDGSTLYFTGYGFNQQAFCVMAGGYKRGAEYLSSSRPIDNDFVYPIYFCYRQALELMLKAIILNCFLPHDRNGTPKERKQVKDMILGHDLDLLFHRICDRLAEKNADFNHDRLKKIRPYIKAFHEFDSNSFMMRYPVDKELFPVNSQKEFMGYDVNYTVNKFNHLWELLCDFYRETQIDWQNNVFLST